MWHMYIEESTCMLWLGKLRVLTLIILSFTFPYWHTCMCFTLNTNLFDDDTVHQRQAYVEWASFSPMAMRRNCTIYTMYITTKKWIVSYVHLHVWIWNLTPSWLIPILHSRSRIINKIMVLDVYVHIKCEFEKYTNLVISSWNNFNLHTRQNCKGLRSDQRVDLSNHYR